MRLTLLPYITLAFVFMYLAVETARCQPRCTSDALKTCNGRVTVGETSQSGENIRVSGAAPDNAAIAGCMREIEKMWPSCQVELVSSKIDQVKQGKNFEMLLISKPLPPDIPALATSTKNCADFANSAETAHEVDEFLSQMKTKAGRHQTLMLTILTKSLSSDKYTASEETRKIWIDKRAPRVKFRDEKTRKTTWGGTKTLRAAAMAISDGEYFYQIGDLSYDPPPGPTKVIRYKAGNSPNLIWELVEDRVRQAQRRMSRTSDGARIIEACYDASSEEERRTFILDENTGLPHKGSDHWKSGYASEYTVQNAQFNSDMDSSLFQYVSPSNSLMIDKVPEQQKMEKLLEIMKSTQNTQNKSLDGGAARGQK